MNVLAAFTLADLGRTLLISLLILVLAAGLFAWGGCISRNRDIPALDPVRPHTFVDENGLHSWGFIARNGVTVHTSDTAFAHKCDLVDHYADIYAAMKSMDTPSLLAPDGNRWRWILNGGNSTRLPRREASDQTFATQKAALENYSDLRKAVLACPPEHLTTID